MEDGAAGFVGGVEVCVLGVKAVEGGEDLGINGIRFVVFET